MLKNLNICLQTVALLVISATAIEFEFDYRNQTFWSDKFHNCLYGAQAPIELNSDEVGISRFDEVPVLEMVNYHATARYPLKMRNTGQHIKIYLLKNIEIYITGGGLLPNKESPNTPIKYIAEYILFHWCNNKKCSEHVINGRKTTIEMQIVHRNNKYYDLERAYNAGRFGIAVVAVLIDVEAGIPPTRGFARIVDALRNIVNYNKTTILKNFNLKQLFDDMTGDAFFTYEGSLTFPPCTPGTWFVFWDIVKISYEQFLPLVALRGIDGAKHEDNFRALQIKYGTQVRMHRF